jgi:hypothetical protein
MSLTHNNLHQERYIYSFVKMYDLCLMMVTLLCYEKVTISNAKNAEITIVMVVQTSNDDYTYETLCIFIHGQS